MTVKAGNKDIGGVRKLPAEHRPDWLFSAPTIEHVVAAVQSAPNEGKLDVRGVLGLNKNVLKLNTLTFADKSTLILEAIDNDFIAIAAQRIVLDIQNPAFKAVISRAVGLLEEKIVDGLKGVDGAPGTKGADGQGEIGRRGQPGSPGTPGGDATDGRTKPLPPLFIFTDELVFGGAASENRGYVDVFYNGLPGGDGGDGGPGGPGGKGSNGKEGASSALDCMEGPGPGGAGGDGGAGGQGGSGGDGASGGTLHLLSADPKLFDYFTGYLEGGAGGRAGAAGDSGRGGRGGRGGGRNGWCGRGRDGRNGATPPNRGPGLSGENGQRGHQYPVQRDNSDIFPPPPPNVK